jgi:hypothetical protein
MGDWMYLKDNLTEHLPLPAFQIYQGHYVGDQVS